MKNEMEMLSTEQRELVKKMFAEFYATIKLGKIEISTKEAYRRLNMEIEHIMVLSEDFAKMVDTEIFLKISKELIFKNLKSKKTCQTPKTKKKQVNKKTSKKVSKKTSTKGTSKKK